MHPWQKIIDAVFTACAGPAGGTALRQGAPERLALLLAGWRDPQARLADTGTRMLAVLTGLDLTSLVTSITGLSAAGAAGILAETGDPRRFAGAGPWSSMPAGPPGRGAPALTPAAPAPPGNAGPRCAWRHDEQSGAR